MLDNPQILHIPINWIPVFIQMTVFLVSGVSAVIAVVWNLAKWKEQLQRDSGEKIQRVYARLDEYKNFTENTFVRKDMCGQMHTSTASAVAEMKGEMKIEIKHLADEIDNLKTLILKRGVS